MDCIDCHAHIFSLAAPLISDRRYTPQHESTEDDYLKTLAMHGVRRGVLIQPSFLGTDNQLMIGALRRHPDKLRGIAVVDPAIRSSELDLLNDAGVVGIRLNLIGREIPDLRKAVWRDHIEQVAAFDWHVEVHCPASALEAVATPLLEVGVKVVVDHFGRPDPSQGTSDPGFQYLLSLAHTDRVWVKLSGAYRNGPGGNSIAKSATSLLRDSFGLSRLVWGSDWPHTMFEESMTYEETLRQLHLWLPEEMDQEVVTSKTPALLFKWEA